MNLLIQYKNIPELQRDQLSVLVCQCDSSPIVPMDPLFQDRYSNSSHLVDCGRIFLRSREDRYAWMDIVSIILASELKSIKLNISLFREKIEDN